MLRKIVKKMGFDLCEGPFRLHIAIVKKGCYLFLWSASILQLQAQHFAVDTFGANNTDRGVGIEQAIENNGFVMVGYTKSFDSKGEDVYVVKTNSEGKLEWQKTYGGDGDDNGWSIKKTADNNYVIAGFTNSYGSGDWDMLLIKIDRYGEEIWSKNYGGIKDQYAWDLVVTADNNYVIIGQTNNSAAGEATSMWLKVDASGGVVWQNQFHNLPMNRAFSILEDKNKSLVFTGLISKSEDNIDGFVARVTPKGELLWKKEYGGKQNDLGHSIKKDKSGHFLMFGYSKSYGTSNNSPWLVKINSVGDELWNYTYGTKAEERIVGGGITLANDYIMLGYIIKENKEAENVDVLVLKVNHTGNLSWARTFGGAQNEESGQNLVISENGAIIFTGRTFSQGLGKGDLFLMKLRG